MKPNKKSFYQRQNEEALKILQKEEQLFKEQGYSNVFDLIAAKYQSDKNFYAKVAKKSGWDILKKNNKFYLAI